MKHHLFQIQERPRYQGFLVDVQIYRVASFPGFREDDARAPATTSDSAALLSPLPYVGAALARSRRNRHVASSSLYPHSIPVAHREGRGRLRAWLPEDSAIRRHVEVRSVQTAETEEVSLLLRPATGPCVLLV